MPLTVVPVSRHVSLGTWGALELSGTSALLRPVLASDMELPEAVAQDVTAGVLLLNDELGRLLYLPYAGEVVWGFDLKSGEPLFSPMELVRNPDRGLRMASFLVIPGLGAAHLTESSLALFRDDGLLAWRRDDDFQGWVLDGRTSHELHLKAGDWVGNVSRQSRSLDDGARLSSEDELT